jgi:hypothetical protein
MYPLSADNQRGPFTLNSHQPLLLGSSPSVYTYFARFYRLGEEILVNHHTISRSPSNVEFNAGPDVMFAPLKKAHVDEEGILSLRWWPGNEALKHRPLALSFSDSELSRGISDCTLDDDGNRLEISAPANGFAYFPTHFNLTRGVVLEGKLTLSRSTGPLSSVGLLIESQQQQTGSLVFLQSDGRLTVGPFNGYSFKPEDSKPFPGQVGTTVYWRILLRGPFLEIYLDEIHVQSYTLNHPAGGRLAFGVEAGTGRMEGMKAWEMPF